MRLRKTLFFCFYCSACVLLMEGLIRLLLFSPLLPPNPIREADRFGSYFSDDDHWKLYYRFGGRFAPVARKRIQPLLGWSQSEVSPQNPLGLSNAALTQLASAKRKILFYGDSFVSVSDDRDSELPVYLGNHLEGFSVVDLSCGGYGLDQMLLMFRVTYEGNPNPIIFFGVLLYDDLDRTALSVRTGQKPFFSVKNNALNLEGVPIDANPRHYYATHPPKVFSYAFRLLLRRFLTRNSYAVFKKPTALDMHFERIAHKKIICAKIIEEIQRTCKKHGYPLLFVLFYDQNGLKDESWQEAFLKEKLTQLNVPFFDTKELLIDYARKHSFGVEQLYMRYGGHHNRLGNSIIAESLMQYVLRHHL